MRNPNNALLPNFFIEDKQHARKWFAEMIERDLDKYLPFPMEYVGKGLTHAEAYYLKDCFCKYFNVMKQHDDKETEQATPDIIG